VLIPTRDPADRSWGPPDAHVTVGVNT
jgi:hypothetical protein